MSTNHELEQRIKRLETLLGRGVEHLSLEPDGTLMIDSLRYDTPQNAGYITDQYGNFIHSRSETGDSWHLDNNAQIAMLRFYWETGNLDIKGNLDVAGDLIVGGKMLVDIFYPVGTYYETSDANFNPNTAWGGTWVLETAGKFHVSAGTNYNIGATGGNAKHYHPLSSNGYVDAIATNNVFYENWIHVTNRQFTLKFPMGGSQQSTTDSNGYAIPLKGKTDDNSNLPPYVAVNRWHRTA